MEYCVRGLRAGRKRGFSNLPATPFRLNAPFLYFGGKTTQQEASKLDSDMQVGTIL